MGTKLERISQLSKENPEMVFTSIGHLINKDLLKECHAKMDADKAVGIDGVTKEEYGRNLEKNLDNLVERLKKKSYKPKPARRVEIPNAKDLLTCAPENLCEHLHLIEAEQSTLQRAGCGKAARPVL